MKMQDAAKVLAYKINCESGTGSEMPLTEYLDIDDGESFSKQADEIIDHETVDMESFVDGAKTVIAKIIEGILWLLEKITSVISNIINFFNVTRMRIKRFKDRLMDIKNTKPIFDVKMQGWEGLGDKPTAEAINDKIARSEAAMKTINAKWPVSSEIIYKNVKDLLAYGREIKNADNILAAVKQASTDLSLDGTYADQISVLQSNLATKNKQTYAWTSTKQLMDVAVGLQSFNEELLKFGSFLQGNTRKGFALKQQFKRFIDTYGKVDENTTFNNTVRDSMKLYTVTLRNSFKVLSHYGSGYASKCLSHLLAVEKEVMKYSK